MKEHTTKQLQRLEKKKAKMAAFLEIARLNDKDKETKLQSLKQMTVITDGCSSPNNNIVGDNSTRKRSCEKNPGDTCSEVCKEENVPESELQDNKKPRLSDSNEYASLKEELRKRKKRLQAIPRLTLKAVGENATLDVQNMRKRIPIFLSDIQHLLLYSLLGHHSPYLPARWCQLEKYNKISHTVVFVLEGLSSYHYVAYESMFPHIVNNLKHRLEVITPAIYGASITEELAAVPLTGTQSDKLIKRYGSLETALQTNGNVIKLLRSVFPMHSINNAEKFPTKNNSDENLPPTDKFCRTKLLLSLWQMVEENYPVPLKGTLAERYGSYILTKNIYKEATSTSPMFGLDCEMCLTTSGNLELTSISIVDETMNVIYNSLVKPENAITNYLTQYSGITKDMLDNVTVTLHDVQQTLRTLLPPDAILIGQSLNSDLHTLKMMHPYIIDTSVIFNLTGDRYRKTKLQILAREFLGESIQNNKAGHCPIEDSKASMKLVKLKLANSVDYGDAVLLGDRSLKALKMEMNEKQTLQKTEIKKYATSIFNHITRNKGTTAAIVGNDEVMSEYSKYLMNSSLNVMDDESFAKDDQVRLVITDSDKHAVDRTSEIAMEHAFVLCHVKLTEEQLKDEQLEETFRTVNKWIHKIWQCSAINSLTCVIFSGQNNTVCANGSCFLNIKTEVSPNITI